MGKWRDNCSNQRTSRNPQRKNGEGKAGFCAQAEAIYPGSPLIANRRIIPFKCSSMICRLFHLGISQWAAPNGERDVWMEIQLQVDFMVHVMVQYIINRSLMRLRPPWIVPASQRYLVGCLCELCHNVSLHLRYSHSSLLVSFFSVSLLTGLFKVVASLQSVVVT